MWSPYKSLVEELMPNANITADRFHVMKQVNDELDNMRKTEKKQQHLYQINQKKREY
ncbi:Transposase [Cylindrospermopsis raciborskii CS-505]|nr:Transposase [Cylindrospermopsis raciborskii CS-505]